MTGVQFNNQDVEIVVVPRECYGPTLKSLSQLLATVPHDVGITLVRGGMPKSVVRRVEALAGERVRVVGPVRHLAGNAARSIGLRLATARFVVFIDNDILPSPGWLEALTSAAEQHGAWVVRPLMLQGIDGRETIHDAGGLCHLETTGMVTALVETHLHMGQTLAEVGRLKPQLVEMFEFHTVLFDRERLVSIGGFDQRMLSTGDHIDLALRVHSAGGSVWFEPASQVLYPLPDRLAVRDLPFFLGRWSPSWTEASRRAFCEKHAVNDVSDPYKTWWYPGFHRTYAWKPLVRVAARLARRPIPRRYIERFDRVIGGRVSDAVLHLAPRWRGGGVEVSD